MEWNTADWGRPEDYGIDPEIKKYQGFPVGEAVVALRDGDEDSHQFWFEGDTGVIIGFVDSPYKGIGAVIYFEGQDPMTCYDMAHLDPAEED